MHPTTELILGLQILCVEGPQAVCAEHDEIYCDCPSDLNEENKRMLDALGWVPTDHGSWSFRP